MSAPAASAKPASPASATGGKKAAPAPTVPSKKAAATPLAAKKQPQPQPQQQPSKAPAVAPPPAKPAAKPAPTVSAAAVASAAAPQPADAPISTYTEQETARLKQRMSNFYARCRPDVITPEELDKNIVEIKRTQMTEPFLFTRLATKYSADAAVELADAREKGLLPATAAAAPAPSSSASNSSSIAAIAPASAAAAAAPAPVSAASAAVAPSSSAPLSDASGHFVPPPIDAKAPTPLPASLPPPASAAPPLKSYAEVDRRRLRRRFEIFYTTHNNTDGLARLDDNMKRLSTSEKSENAVFAELCAKYNVDPAAEVAAARAAMVYPAFAAAPTPRPTPKTAALDGGAGVAVAASGTAKPLRDYDETQRARVRKRVERFYGRFAPAALDKMDNLDKVFTPGTMTEAHLMELLCSKYNVAPSSKEADADNPFLPPSVTPSTKATPQQPAMQPAAPAVQPTPKATPSQQSIAAAAATTTPAEPFLRSYSDADKERFRQRLLLLYTTHKLEDGLAKLDKNLAVLFKGDFVESSVIASACSKNNVAPAAELEAAREKKLLPASLMLTAAPATPAATVVDPLAILSTAAAATSAAPAASANEATGTAAAVAAAADVAPVAVRDYSDVQKARFRRRVALFYENHARHELPTMDDKIGVVLKNSATDETTLLVKLCQKNNVDPAVEAHEAAEAGLQQGQREQDLLRRLPVRDLLDGSAEKERLRRRLELFYANHAPAGTGEKSVPVAMQFKVGMEELIAKCCAKYNVPATTELHEARAAGLLPGADPAAVAAAAGASRRPTPLQTPAISALNPATDNSYIRTESEALVEQARHGGIPSPVAGDGQSPGQLRRAWKDRLVDEHRALDYFRHVRAAISKEDVDPHQGGGFFDDSSFLNSSNISSAQPSPTARRAVVPPVLVTELLQQQPTSNNALDRLTAAALQKQQQQQQPPTPLAGSPFARTAAGAPGGLSAPRDQQSAERSSQSDSVLLFGADDGLSLLQLRSSPQRASAASAAAPVPEPSFNDTDSLVSVATISKQPAANPPAAAGAAATATPPAGAPPAKATTPSASSSTLQRTPLDQALSPLLSRKGSGAPAPGSAAAAAAATDVAVRDYSAAEQERLRKRLHLFYSSYPSAKDGLAKLDENMKKLTGPKAPPNFETVIFAKMCERYAVDPAAETKAAGAAGVLPTRAAEPAPAPEAAAAAAAAAPAPTAAATAGASIPTSAVGTPASAALSLSARAVPVAEYSNGEKARLRRRIALFYHHHNQAGLADLDDKMSRLFALAVTEEDVVRRLCESRGVDPAVEADEARAAGCFERIVESEWSVRNLPAADKARFLRRLTLFYERYAPDKVPAADKALEFALTEQQVFRRVCEKYKVEALTEEVVAKAHGVWAPPPPPAFLSTAVSSSAGNSQPVSPTASFRARKNASAVDERPFTSPSPIVRRAFNEGANKHIAGIPAHDAADDDDGDESLFMMPTAEELFERFLHLSNPRKQEMEARREQEWARSVVQSPGMSPALPVGEASFAPALHFYPDQSSRRSATALSPLSPPSREVVNEWSKAHLSEEERSRMWPPAEQQQQQPAAGYFVSSRPLAQPREHHKSSNSAAIDDEDVAHLSPRSAKTHRLLAALVDEYQLARDESQTLVQVAWGATLSPEALRAQRERLVTNRVPWNAFPIVTPDAGDGRDPYELAASPSPSPARKQPEKGAHCDPAVMTVAEHRQRFVSSEAIDTPTPNKGAPVHALQPPPHMRRDHSPRRVIDGRVLAARLDFGGGAAADADKSLVADPFDKTVMMSAGGAKALPAAAATLTSSQAAAGPVFDDALVETFIQEQLAAFLPSKVSSAASSRAGSVQQQQQQIAGGGGRRKSSSRGRGESATGVPLSLTFHSVGSLPCPDNVLPCPICGEEIQELVVDTASTRANADVFSLAGSSSSRTQQQQQQQQPDEGATRAGMHLQMRLSSLRSTDAVQSVSCHLDRCTKRRRSFEEQVFAHSRRRDATAHMLLHCLGAITSFSQRAKRWSLETEQHRAAVDAFFRDAELLRMRHTGGSSSNQRGAAAAVDDSVIIARDANLFDEFLGREVELFETGTRLLAEQDQLAAKAREIVRQLELPCPMGERCINCVAHARAVRTPTSSRAGTPVDGSDNAGGSASAPPSVSVLDRGHITHSDVQDHAVACWEVTFTVEKAVGQLESLADSTGAGFALDPMQVAQSRVRGATLRCAVPSGQATLWSLLSRRCPSLVLRAANAPQHYVDRCAAELAQGEDEIEGLFRASGLDPAHAAAEDEQWRRRHEEEQRALQAQRRPRHVRFVEHDAADGRDEPMVRVVFMRSFDNEVVDGSTPLWRLYWLDFTVFIL